MTLGTQISGDQNMQTEQLFVDIQTGRTNLGDYGFIDWSQDQKDSTKYHVYVNLTGKALTVLSIHFGIKQALETNEFDVRAIEYNTVRSYVEDQLKECSLAGRPSGEVIGKFMLKTDIRYDRSTLTSESEIYHFDTTSSGRCVAEGAVITLWRSWFTKHFYETINNKIPDIIRQVDLPVDRIWIEDDLLKVYSKVDSKPIVDKIIAETKKRLNQAILDAQVAQSAPTRPFTTGYSLNSSTNSNGYTASRPATDLPKAKL